MRLTLSGASCASQSSHTPRVDKAVTDPATRKVVRLSGRSERFPTSTVVSPPKLSVIAAVRPAGPPPTTIAAGLSPLLPYLSDIKAPDPVWPTFLRHDLIRKPVPTFRDRALTGLACAGCRRKPRLRLPVPQSQPMRYARSCLLYTSP